MKANEPLYYLGTNGYEWRVSPVKGNRVQGSPHLDSWAMGDRYGEILELRVELNDRGGEGIAALVKWDKSGRVAWYKLHDLKPLN